MLKNTPNVSEMLISVVKRILKNLETDVLVVEDSFTTRLIIANVLQTIGLRIYQVSTIEEAERVLFKEGKKFKLIVLDYYLEKEAIDFLIRIRNQYSRYQLAVLVISAYVSNIFVPHLLKVGANDFLRKPFLEEEMKVRVNNLLSYLDALKELEFMASHDSLTGLLNRRSFFERVEKMLSLAKREKLGVATVLFDIDYFKKINDTYGHQVGDTVLMDFAEKLKSWFKRETDLIARYGGEEFLLVCLYRDKDLFLSYLENFKNFVSKTPLFFKNLRVSYTFSAGVELQIKENIEDMIKSADIKLYLAKTSGRNRIEWEH